MNRLEELLLLWQDGTTTAAELAEFKKLLATPAARAAVVADFFLTGTVLEALRVQRAAQDSLARAEPRKPVAADDDQRQIPVRRGRIAAYGFWTVALSLLIFCSTYYWFQAPRKGPVVDASGMPRAFAEVEQVQGEFFVIADQRMRLAQTGELLVPGQGIATEGTESGAVVRMKNDVRLQLGGNTTVFTTIDEDQPASGGSRLVLEKGDLLVEVTRSLKRKKMSVQTALGLAVAESEEAALHVSDAAGVIVVRGEVSFLHKATGKSIRLAQGQYLAITAAGDLHAAQFFAASPQIWTTFPRIGLDTAALSHSLAFSPQGEYLAAVNRPGEGGVRFGPRDGKSPPREWKGDNCVRFSPDGKWLAAADVANVRLYDRADDSQVRVFPTKERKRRVQCLAFSPDGQFLAVGRAAVKSSAEVEIWDVNAGIVRHTWRKHTATVTCLAFSPDGKFLATGSLDKTVVLWDMDIFEERAQVVANPTQPVWALAFAPTGDTLAIGTGPDDFRVRQPGELALYSIRDGQVRRRLHGHYLAITSVVFSRDGQTIITGSADTTVRFWDLKTGRQYGMLKGHKAAPGFEAIMVALSPDGSTLATASLDQSVKLWPTTWIREHASTSAHLPDRRAGVLACSLGDVP